MNDVQAQMMTLKRHHQLLERSRAEAKAAVTPQQNFADAMKAAEPAAAPTTAPAVAVAPPAAQPIRVMATTPTAQPAAIPSLPPDQAALLAASLGATLPEAPAPAAAAAAATATPELSGSQMDTLMAAFGQPQPEAAAATPTPALPTADALPQTEAAMAATAIPQAQADNLVFFPVNNANSRGIANPADNARQTTASDTYLRAMQQMETNLGAYGSRVRNGR